MVRVKGPLFSLGASGVFKNKIEFRTGSGRTLATSPRRNKPARSEAQQAQANKFKGAITAWREAGDEVRQAWKSASQLTGLNGYQFFLSEYSAQNINPPDLPVVP